MSHASPVPVLTIDGPSGSGKGTISALVAEHPAIFDSVRGQGLMLGLKMKVPNGDFIKAARDAGLIVLPAGDNVVRLLPALTMSETEAREGVALMHQAAAALEPEKAMAK